MSMTDLRHLRRRSFLGRLSASAVGVAAAAVAPERLAGMSTGARPEYHPDGWIGRLRGTDRLVLHAHQHFAPALRAAQGILASGREAYGLGDRENSLAVATHGPAIAGLFTDAIWERHSFGAMYRIDTPETGAPAIRNPYLRGGDGTAAAPSVPALMDRGVVFLVCNVAVRSLARRIAVGTDIEGAYDELVAGLVRGVVVVPNVYIAIAHAQKAGVGYLFID